MRVARSLLAVAAILAGSVLAANLLLGGSSSPPPEATRAAAVAGAPEAGPPGGPRHASPPPPAVDSRVTSPVALAGLLAASAAASWDSLARSIPARIGLAVAPLGPGPMRVFGSLRSGHAWSSIKVPILVALLREQEGRGLTAEESTWARAALTSSDNSAARALFSRIEAVRGDLSGASLAVQGVLRASGDEITTVATAPPPSGAVSTYGQTEWSLPASVAFFRALGRGCLLNSADTGYVLGLMGEVIPEQRWGLGEAGFPPNWTVAMKGGWGPEGSAAGPYLVRQSGIVANGDSGVVIAMIAKADSGSFDAGTEALDRIATWLRTNLRGLGPPIARGC